MPKKVMVVDDDPTTRFMMAEFLDALGFEHSVVSSGSECLAQLMTDPSSFYAVLMDIHMPHVTGLDTCGWIRGLESDPPCNIPIIALTADNQYHRPEDVAPFGMTDVLPKPVSLDDLNEKLTRFATAEH
ncbi:MAG: response regulator [Sedimentitalea sp.]